MVARTLLHLFIFVHLVAADRTCYFPGGDVAIDDVPCFSGEADSPCCSKNSLCLSNGFCYGLSQPYALSRGSCTNKNWPANGACDDKCSDGKQVSFTSELLIKINSLFPPWLQLPRGATQGAHCRFIVISTKSLTIAPTQSQSIHRATRLVTQVLPLRSTTQS